MHCNSDSKKVLQLIKKSFYSFLVKNGPVSSFKVLNLNLFTGTFNMRSEESEGGHH